MHERRLEQSIKAESVVGLGPALALILLKVENAFSRPTGDDGAMDESTWAIGRGS
jgi:hypothetical protein